MSGLRKKMAHMKNKRMDEGALRNVLLELKDVVKPIGTYDKQVTNACGYLKSWADTQTPDINKLITELNQIEDHLCESNSTYIKDYLEYSQYWNTILVERKELKALVDQHKSAESVLESDKKRLMDAQKKEKGGSKLSLTAEVEAVTKNATDAANAESAAAKESASGDGAKKEHKPIPKLSKVKKGSSVDVCKAAVTEAVKTVNKLAEQIREKELEVQKDVHDNLRKAYYKLMTSRLSKCRREANLHDRGLALISNFPRVTTYDAEKGEFLTEPYKELPGPAVSSVWHRGDVIQKNLEIEREAARHALESERKRGSEALAKLQKQYNEMKTSLEEKLEDLNRQHNTLMSSLKEASEMKEGSLQEQVQSLTVEKHSLKEDVRALQKGMVQLSLNQSLKTIESASEACDRDIAAFFLEKCEAALETLKAVTAQAEWPKNEFVFKSNNFARDAASTLMSAVGSAQTLKVEKATGLVALAKAACTSSTAYVKLAAEKLHPDADSGDSVQAPPDADVKKDFEALLKVAKELNSEEDLPEEVAESVSFAQRMIRDTLATIQELQKKVDETQKGREKEVNTEMLTTSKEMFGHASDVIEASLKLQHDLKVDPTKGNASDAVVQRKWIETLAGAVDTVAEAAPLWSECTRQVIKNQTKYEELQVATRSLAAFGAQLVANTRTRESTCGTQKGTVEKSTNCVINTSHKVLDSIREAQNLKLASLMLEDYSNLTEVQAKKMIMNAQVDVLKLESELQSNQEKLRRLRRLNYDDMKTSPTKAAGPPKAAKPPSPPAASVVEETSALADSGLKSASAKVEEASALADSGLKKTQAAL